MWQDQVLNNYSQKYKAPLLKTPVTDWFMQINNLQFRKDCMPYELMYSDCLEAYGYHIGKEKCRIILNDMHECIYRAKRIERVLKMHYERRRQYKSGERKEYYPPSPPLDLF
ncbi:uncharacterized protein LOC105180526 [Harpegnathos saltator]|uniref:Uncharacterized protein n=1 Tax=Harpegnathos saltator TaxID=610380 RepID=E2BA22_HARSA|nr:uncharacterized protein LOC105180526 [Harpegnathos saltator]XP_011134936.1 uncharacterized protein LOC105180526 [Harpegnathos saltator]XP_011134937.1 uncharacterized protein LOC105180526 [Harpegnathos saltator]EFN87431.1 hypothetical protein EAI_00367 [Harpegnathos saltator]